MEPPFLKYGRAAFLFISFLTSFVKNFLCYKNGQSLLWQNPETFGRYGCYYEEPQQGDWPKLGTYWIYTVKENSGNNGDYHLLPEIHSGFYYLRVSNGNQASAMFKLVILK